MSSTATPYGMVPVKMLGGQYHTGAFRKIPIASGYDTSIFTGDLVKLVAAGGVEKDTGTTAATPVGIFVGCEYTDPSSSQFLQRQYFPANTAADDIVAFVVDDPDVIFKIQADGSITAADVGENAALVQTAGSTSTGNSKVALDASSTATTNTLPVRIVGLYADPENAFGDAYTDVLVKWNAGHQYGNTTGLG